MAAQLKQDPLTEVLQKIRERKTIKPEEAAKALAQYTTVQEQIKELKAEIQILKKNTENAGSAKTVNTILSQSPRRSGKQSQQPNNNKHMIQQSPKRTLSPPPKSPVKIINGPKHPSDPKPNGGVKQASPGGKPAPRVVNAPPPPSDGSVSPTRSIKVSASLNNLDTIGNRATDRRRSSVGSKSFSDMGKNNGYTELHKDKEIEKLRLQNAQLKVLVDKQISPTEGSKADSESNTFASAVQRRDIPKPDKVVQEFKKLFDNEWKNAYFELEKHHKISEDSITDLLGVVAKEAYNFCQNVAKQQFDDIVTAHSHVTDILVQPKYISLSSKDVYTAKSKSIIDKEGYKVTRKFLRDYRRLMARISLPGLIEIFNEILQRDILARHSSLRVSVKTLKPYTHRLIELNWFMCLSEPPMYQLWLRKGQLMSREHFTCYLGNKGATVVHTVWPAVLYQSGGFIAERGFVKTK